jgi:choline dehydrogenase
MKPVDFAAVQSTAWLCHPASRGAITLRSADPSDSPVIRHNLIGDPSDIVTLTAGARLLREIFQQDAFRPYVTGEISPGPAVQSDADWEAYLRGHAHRGNHPSGTCKMGVDELAVVDPALRVRGVEALRVVDASVMPNLITGHTNAPVIMIAERAADLVRGERHRPAR